MQNKYTIAGELADLNTYINAERTNRFIAASIKKKATSLCQEAASGLEIEMGGLYDVSIDWFVKDNRKDSDNIFFATKFILDGLVLSGKICGDGRRYIRNIKHTIQNDCKNPRAEVELIKVS